MGLDDRFCQRNPLWISRPLGRSGAYSLGSSGCLVCCVTRMAWRATGRVWTPWEMNKALVAANGFEPDDDLRYAAVKKVCPALSFVAKRDYTARPFPPSDEGIIRQHVGQGDFAIVETDFDPIYRPGQQKHFVLLERIVDDPYCLPFGAWHCYDPWHGEVVEIGEYNSPYGRHLDYAVWAVVLYEVVR